MQVPASGGTPSALTRLDSSLGEYNHALPQALPNGQFLYLALSRKQEDCGIYAASFAKPHERKRLLSTTTNALYVRGGDGKTYLLWRQGHALVAQEFDAGSLRLLGSAHPLIDDLPLENGPRLSVQASATGRLLYNPWKRSAQFMWFDRSGRRLGTVGEPGEYSDFRLSPDERQVAAARFEYDRSDIWILEPAREAVRRFTLSGFNRFPVWSPDGRVLMHSSSGRGWVSQETSGSGEEQPVVSPGQPRDWSRDGHWILYSVIDPETKADVWVLPVMPEGRSAPGAKGTPYLRSPFNESAPRFSPEPNPHWVAYNSDESGRSEVYVASFFQYRASESRSPQPADCIRSGQRTDGHYITFRRIPG